MKRNSIGRMGMLACGLAMLVSLAPARAETVDPLQVVPGEAWASLTIRNLGEFDNKLMALSQRLNAFPGSPLEMLKGMMQLNGVNNDAGAAVVMMPMLGAPDPQSSMAILVPCSDYAALTANMSVEEAVGGVSRCMLMGTEESYIAQMGEYAIVGPTSAGVQSLLAAKGKPTIGTTWTAHQLDRFAKDDATLHFNLKGIVSSPMVQGMLQMLAASGGGMINPQELSELESATISIRLNDDGLNLGVYWGAVEGSASAKLFESAKPTSSSLLTGLPAGDYMGAFGVKGSKEVWGKYAETYSGILTNPMIAMQLNADPAKMQEVATKAAALIGDVRDVSVAANALPGGDDGMLGVAKVLSFESGAKAKCAQMGEIITAMLSGMFTGEEAQAALSNIQFKSGAETLGDVSVDHLVIAMDKMDGVSEKECGEMKKVFGSDGFLIRMAAIDDTHVAVTFGGGKSFMEDVAGLAKAGGAPLGKDEGIAKVGGILPSKKTFEGYLSADHIMAFVTAFTKVVGDDSPPPFPKVGVPVGMVGAPVGNGGFQFDLAVPMELIVAGKDYAMSMQGGAPPASDPGEPAPSEAADSETDEG